MDLTLLLDDADLRLRFGSATFDRAADYVRRGKVLACLHEPDEDGDLDVRGSVEGSGGEVYNTTVSVGHSDRVWVYARCTCPVREGCKHALALLLTVRARQEEEHAGGPARHWERRLASVLDELDAVPDRPRDLTPLALQVELNRRASTGYRWEQPSAPRRGTLRIRPVRRGARDNWVRTGISWTDVQHAVPGRRGFPPEQVGLLAEMLAAYRAAQRSLYFGGADTHLPLSAFGPTLWPLLHRCPETGLALVPGAGLTGVTVSPEPLSIQVDVNAAPDRRGTPAARRRGPARSGTRSDRLDLLGEDGHGVALWRAGDRDDWAVTLAPLAKPAGPEVRRLLTTADDLVGAGRGPSRTWWRSTCPGCSATCRWSPPTARLRCPSRSSRGCAWPWSGGPSTRSGSRGAGATASARTTGSTVSTTRAACAASAGPRASTSCGPSSRPR